jgi:hypothetical protein
LRDWRLSAKNQGIFFRQRWKEGDPILLAVDKEYWFGYDAASTTGLIYIDYDTKADRGPASRGRISGYAKSL